VIAVRNPLTMNDWELKKTLLVTAVLQVAFLASAGLTYRGAPLLIVQQATGCIFLLFIPGILLLRVLKLHNLGSVATPLYAVGLSIATLMFSGLFINQVYPYLGITRPIAALPLLITLSAVVDILCLVAVVRDRTFSATDSLDLRAVVSPPTLALCLIPFVSIFGTYVMNGTSNNAILLLLIVLLAALVIVLTFRRDVPRHVYPLAVFVSALSLLYYESLISNYLVGWDIQEERYLAGLVIANGSWNPTLSISNYNSALSSVLLGPILSVTCGISIVSVFKVVYPLIFALVPVVLYLVFRQQTNDKVAFLSAFLFLGVDIFFSDMIGLARQEIAELFLVLIVLIMVARESERRSLLLTIFAFALIVSHYGLAYVFIFLLLVALLGLALLDSRTMRRISRIGRSRSSAQTSVAPFRSAASTRDVTRRLITLGFVVLFIVASQLWYIYTSGGGVFYNAVTAVSAVASGFSDLLSPSATGAGVITSATTSPLHNVAKDLYLIVESLIVVGIIALLAKKTRMRFNKEYAALAVASFFLLVVVFAVPFVAGNLNTSRFLQITLIFLAPFAVIGGLAIVRAASRVIRIPCKSKCETSFLKAFSIFLAIFLLFTTGFVYAIADKPNSTAVPLNASFDAPRFNDQEVAGAVWLSNEQNNSSLVYADVYRAQLLADYFPIANEISGNNSLPAGADVYLGSLNVQQGKLVDVNHAGGAGIRFYTDAVAVTAGRTRIYDNGGAQVYR
jgi:uncharacterized membrane protein